MRAVSPTGFSDHDPKNRDLDVSSDSLKSDIFSRVSVCLSVIIFLFTLFRFCCALRLADSHTQCNIGTLD